MSGYDFFIAHAGPNLDQALQLFDLLHTKCRVFLDKKCLILGDDWDVELASAQRDSAVTVVLVSSHSSSAYYQREEIAAAISMARDDAQRHRVVPVFLDPAASSSASVPYGLRLKHSLTLPSTGSFDGVAQSLLELKFRVESASTQTQHTTSGPPNGNGPSPPPAKSPLLQAVLATVCSGVDKLGNYKDIHDQFHQMQQNCLDCLTRNLRRLPEGSIDWEEVGISSEQMGYIAGELEHIGARGPGEYDVWSSSVKRIVEELRFAVEESSEARLRRCHMTMGILLGTQPTYVVIRLNASARGLLPELRKLQQHEEAAGVKALEARLAQLVDSHDRWQELDNLLRQTNPAVIPAEFWHPDVERLAAHLMQGVSEPWMTTFRNALEALSAALLIGDADKIRKHFETLKGRTGLQFQRTDTELKRRCDELRMVDGPFGFLWRAA